MTCSSGQEEKRDMQGPSWKISSMFTRFNGKSCLCSVSEQRHWYCSALSNKERFHQPFDKMLVDQAQQLCYVRVA